MSYHSLAVTTVGSLLVESPGYGDDRGKVKTLSIKGGLFFLGSIKASFASFPVERMPVCQHGEVVGET